jgi:hypothetical protein
MLHSLPLRGPSRHSARIFLKAGALKRWRDNGARGVTPIRHSGPLECMPRVSEGASHVAPSTSTSTRTRGDLWPIPEFLDIDDSERAAFLLRRFQGLNDGQIGQVMGITRETVNRKINRFLRKVAGLRLACPGSCEVVDKLVGR